MPVIGLQLIISFIKISKHFRRLNKPHYMKFTWLILALIAGAFLPIQAGLNARMAKSLANPVYASAVSFIMGTMALLIYIGLTRQQAVWAGFKSAPLYAYAVSVLCAFYVTVIILAFPRIGPALTFGLVVAGQLITSVLLDHFNVMVAAPHPINWWRVFGVVLIIAGVVIIRRF